MNIVEKLVLFCLLPSYLLCLVFYVCQSFSCSFPGTDLDPMVMAEWRTRTIQPAFYMTACYFILRHFLGKNPTTTLWPVFLILLFFTLTQALLFIDRPYKFGIPGIGMFAVSIFVTLFVRLSHSKRKKK